jgi:SAM-dependent methyltransferase
MRQASWNAGLPEADMNVLQRIKNALRGTKQRWGSSWTKRRLWNQEFANGRWDFIENTSGDLIYGYIEKYSRNGSILDLGCGSGNTGCELNMEKYGEYTGVDISDVAIEKANQRSAANHRGKKNHYQQSYISTYTPSQKYNVILFRESIYYIPRPKIKPVLDHYSRFLKPDGVFILRSHDPRQREIILSLLGDAYAIVEQPSTTNIGPMVIVFRRKADVLA